MLFLLLGCVGGVLFMLVGAYVTILGQQAVAGPSRPARATPPLPDVLHRLEWAWLADYYWVADACAPALLGLLLPYGMLCEPAVLLAYLWSQGALFLLRPAFFWPTKLPNCCPLPRKTSYDRSAAAVLWDYVRLADRHHGHESDLIFSGHASALFLHAMMIQQFVIPNAASVLVWAIASTAVWLYAAAVAALVVVTRCHYTVCVVSALPVAALVFMFIAAPIVSSARMGAANVA